MNIFRILRGVPPFILFTCCSFVSYAQSEGEIIASYRSALQKSASEEDIQTMDIRGEFVVDKLSFPATIYYRSPGLTRVEMTFQSLTFLQVANDSLKWEYNPMHDENTVTPVEKGVGNKAEQNSTFDFVSTDLLDYESLNYQVKLLGKKKMDSLQVYVLELKKDKSSGGKSKIYLDTRTSLVYKIEDSKGFRYFTNYTVFDGIVFPMKVIDSSTKQVVEMNFNELNFNSPLPDSLFAIPDHVLRDTRKPSNEASKELERGDEYYNQSQFDSAVSCYSKAIAISPDSYRGFNSRGLTQIERENYYEAITDFMRAIEIDPEDARAVNNLGLAKYYLGDNEGAVKDYSKAITINPSFAIAIKNRGLAYMNLEKYQEASDDFSAAARLNPTDGVAHFKNGNALAQLEHYDEALNAYELALKNGYEGADLFNYKGVSEYKLEQYENAKNSFEEAVKLAPDNLQYLENYGRTYYELGDYASATEQFELYVKKQDDQPEIFNLAGLCKYQDENFKGAIRDFSKSIQLNGKNATYYNNRASAKEMIEDYEGAIHDYSESIQIYPNDARVFYKRGLIKIHTSRKMEGCMDLATANEMNLESAKEAIMKNCN